MPPEITSDQDKQQVTAMISELVKPGKEAEYEQWLREISSAAQQFEGHTGVNFIRPQDPKYPKYVIILKFDCYGHLKDWLDSPVRQFWIDQAKPLVQKEQEMQVLTGLETWFTLPGQVGQSPPKRYKMAILTSVSVFIVAQFLRVVLAPILIQFPPLLGALISTVLTVFLLTYVVMPRVSRAFRRWLYPEQE